MADEAPMGISISRDGINLYANRACLRMFGYESSQEFIGTSQLNRVAPDYRWQMNLNISKRKRGEAVPNQYEFMGLRKDGSTFPVFIDVSRVRLGETLLSVAFFTDFTERKRIEAALGSSEKRYRTLVETAEDFITEVTARGVIVYASPRLYDITGYKPAEVLGKTPFDFMDSRHAARWRRFFDEKVKNKERIKGFQNTLILPDGSSLTLETNASPSLIPTEAARLLRRIPRHHASEKTGRAAGKRAALPESLRRSMSTSPRAMRQESAPTQARSCTTSSDTGRTR
jgi:PAS domain S-box-containing protein